MNALTGICHPPGFKCFRVNSPAILRGVASTTPPDSSSTGAKSPRPFSEDSCYFFSATPLKIHDAVGACAHKGGAFLAAFETPEENERVKREIRRWDGVVGEGSAAESDGGGGSALRNWALGATDEHAEGRWAWLTTEGFVEMTYGDWMEGKPDNGGGVEGEHYLQLNGATGDLKWDDVGNIDSNFICEYNPWKD